MTKKVTSKAAAVKQPVTKTVKKQVGKKPAPKKVSKPVSKSVSKPVSKTRSKVVKGVPVDIHRTEPKWGLVPDTDKFVRSNSTPIDFRQLALSETAPSKKSFWRRLVDLIAS